MTRLRDDSICPRRRFNVMARYAAAFAQIAAGKPRGHGRKSRRQYTRLTKARPVVAKV
jgi:hypothetical protein